MKDITSQLKNMIMAQEGAVKISIKKKQEKGNVSLSFVKGVQPQDSTMCGSLLYRYVEAQVANIYQYLGNFLVIFIKDKSHFCGKHGPHNIFIQFRFPYAYHFKGDIAFKSSYLYELFPV